jgi:hypothetical protein
LVGRTLDFSFYHSLSRDEKKERGRNGRKRSF